MSNVLWCFIVIGNDGNKCQKIVAFKGWNSKGTNEVEQNIVWYQLQNR